MNEEVAALTIRLEATRARFERDMDRARRIFGRTADGIDRRAERLNRRLASTGDRFGQGLSRQGRASLVNFGQQLQDVAVQAQMGTDSLRIFSQQGPQILSVFGPVGVLLGVVAASSGALASGLLGASEEADKFKSAADALAGALAGIQKAEDLASLSLEELRQRFGDNIEAVNQWRVALAEINVAEARRELESLSVPLDELIERFSAPLPDFATGGIAAGIQGEQFRNTIQSIVETLNVSEEAALRLNAALRDVGDAATFDDQIARMGDLLVVLDDIGVKIGDLPPELRDAFKAMSNLSLETFEAEKAASDLEAALAAGTDQTGAFVSEMERLKVAANEAARAAERAFNMETTRFALRFRDEDELMSLPVEVDRTNASAGRARRRSSAGSRRRSSTRAPRESAFDRQAAAASEGLRRAQEEIALLGLSEQARMRQAAAFDRERLARELVNAAQRDGTAATPEEIALAENLARETEALTILEFNRVQTLEALERGAELARRTQEDLAQSIGEVGESLIETAAQANSLEDALQRVGLKLLEVAANAAFGLGPLGGTFNKLIGSAGGGLLGLAFGAASGGALPGGGFFGNVQAFAKGGVVNAPEVFPHRGGLGLRGEAGPEGILPLKRGPDGSLGVAAVGGAGGGTSVVVNATFEGVNGATRAMLDHQMAALKREILAAVPGVASAGFRRNPALRKG